MSSEYWRQSPYEGIQISDQGHLRDAASGELIEVKSYQTKRNGPAYKRFRRRYIHEMVLTTFDRPSRPREQCRHLNGDSLDNRWPENLAWGTASEDNYDRIRHGTHQHANRELCKRGHQFDSVILKPDGTVLQRRCSECQRIQNREKKRRKREKLQTCPQGHPFDGVRYNADGSVRQRYCTVCVSDQLERGRRTRFG